MKNGQPKCDRCDGVMISEKIFPGNEPLQAWKCIYCGEYLDLVILENRQLNGCRESAPNKQFTLQCKPPNKSG